MGLTDIGVMESQEVHKCKENSEPGMGMKSPGTSSHWTGADVLTAWRSLKQHPY